MNPDDKTIPRTLVKLGSNSLVITLPRRWIDKNMLKKSDIVFITEKNNQLIVSGKNKPEITPKEINIEIDHKNLINIRAELVNAYLTGYEIIRFIGDSVKTESSKIKTLIQDLMGLEIIEQTGRSIVARELLDIEKTSIKNTLHRIDYLIRGMLDDLTNIKSEEDIEHLYDRDFDVNRLSHLIFRTIYKAFEYPHILEVMGMDYINLIHYRTWTDNLESIGDSIKRVSRIMYLGKENQNKELMDILKYFKKLYLDTMETVYKHDKNTAYQIGIDNDKRIMKCKKYLHDNPKYYAAEISSHLQNFSRCLRDISWTVCESEVNK